MTAKATCGSGSLSARSSGGMPPGESVWYIATATEVRISAGESVRASASIGMEREGRIARVSANSRFEFQHEEFSLSNSDSARLTTDSSL